MGLGLCTDRLFLTWTSSGLRLLNALLMGWLVWEVSSPTREQGQCALAWASGMALVRPDGYLFIRTLDCSAVASAASCALHVARAGAPSGLAGRPGRSPCRVAQIVLLRWLPIPILPRLWGPCRSRGLVPDLFVIEHGVLWVAVAVGLAVWGYPREGEDTPAPWKWVAGGSLVFHTLYYVVFAGGDHFEYRILSHWGPWLGMVWAVAELIPRGTGLRVGVCGFVVPDHSLTWVHLGSQSHTEWSRSTPDYSIEKNLPGCVPLGAEFDRLQQDLFRHAWAAPSTPQVVYGASTQNVPSREEACTRRGREESGRGGYQCRDILLRFLDAHASTCLT